MRLAGLLGLTVAALLSGCAMDVAHWGRAVGGHLAVMNAAKPIEDWIEDPATSAALRDRLRLAQDIRDFASRELALPDNASYRRYADLGRAAVVWNVVAAPEWSFELKTWCYPVVGCVGYRGHFDEQRARAEAQALKSQGWEVHVYGVPAYSTLGWTNWLGGDPLLNTFALGSAIDLARLVFHELAHQVTYPKDDMAFSESYATAVERLGLAQWARHASSAAISRDEWARWQRRQDQRRELSVLIEAHRAELAALYRSRMADDARRERKRAIQDSFQGRYEALRDGAWGGDRAFDAWVAGLNNAALALQGSYEDGVPGFLALFQREGCDFARWHAHVRELAEQPAAQRREVLHRLATGALPRMPPHVGCHL